MVAQFLLGIAGLSLVTFVCFQVGFGVARTGFAYVILIALVSLLGSWSASIALSVLAAACLNLFFAPPLFEFRIDLPEDIERVAAFLATALVVTALTAKLQRAQKELEQDKTRWKKAERIAHFGWWERDFTTEHVSLSDEISRIFGLRPVDLPEWHSRWLDSIQPEDRAKVADAAAAALCPGGPRFDVEYRIVRPDGALRVIRSQGDVSWDKSGRPLRQFGVLHDVTELRQVEQELRASEAKLERAQAIAHVGWWERDFTRNRVSYSDEAYRIFGIQPGDLPKWSGQALDLGHVELIHPEDRAKVLEKIRAALVPAGPRYDVEYRLVRPDGAVRMVHSQGDVTRDETGGTLRQFGVLQDITDLRQAEQELRVSEARFRTFVDYATDAFLLFDDDAIILDVNRQACENLGYSRQELIGKHPTEFDLHLDQASIDRLRQRMLAGEVVTFETRHKRKDGTTFPVEVRVGHFQQAGRRYLSLARDISERKRNEDELRASEERFRILVDHASDAFFLYNEDATVLDVNRQACESLGYRRDELIGMTAFDYGPDLTPELLERIRERLRSGKTVTYDGRHRRKDGTEFPVEVRIRPFWREGRLLAVSLDRDITQRKRAEHELRVSEERFRTLMQFSFDVYWETDAQHRLVRQEFDAGVVDAPVPIGKTRWEQPYLEPDAEAWRKHRETLDAHLPFRDFEIARPTADGGKSYWSVSGLPVFDEAGRFVGHRGVGRQITERKQAEEALRRSEAYLAEAQRLSHTGTSVFNANGNLYWSEECYRIWDLDRAQGVPDTGTVLQRVHPDDRDRVREEMQKALHQKRELALDFRVLRPDGTVKHIQSISHPLLSANGEIAEVVTTHVDVTERRRAQEQAERLRQLEVDLAHVNRLSVMGELTASLAHEVLHPIATARNNARTGMRLLEMSPPNLAEIMDALGCVVKDVDRARDIIGGIRAHIKKALPRVELFDLNKAIDEVIVMVRGAIERNGVSVHTRLMDNAQFVRGDRVQVQQVVLNLILNAVEAMSSVEQDMRELSIGTEPSQANSILIAVRDSGPGIDPEHLERIFEPFYTTKSGGMGMGLSICRSIVDAHGGRLWAESNRPRGATFQFTLPAGVEGS